MVKITKKDRAAIAKVARDLRQRKPRKGKAPHKRQPMAATRSMGEIVLAQGVGRVPRTPFGGTPGTSIRCWDAFDHSHAGLPRSVGPYAIVRTTRIFSTSARFNLFGTAVDEYNNWTTTIAWSAGASLDTSAVNAHNGVYAHVTNPPGALIGDSSNFTCVPSAMSVQIMNPQSLNNAGGIIFSAVCPTQLSMCDNTRTWGEFESSFTAYMRPRLMSGGKLALRGVQMNAYPLNMNALSDFQKITDYGDGTKTWASDSGNAGDAQYLAGFTPMVVINTSGEDLTYAVCVEYRVRFDLTNPAVSSHRHHPVTTDRTWDGMVKKAIALGNGVKDIADVVATMGQTYRGTSNALSLALREG